MFRVWCGRMLLYCFNQMLMALYWVALMPGVASRNLLIQVTALLSGCAVVGAAFVSYESRKFVTLLLIAMVFFYQFYVPLIAHMQKVVPGELLGRASANFFLVSVLGIPTCQVAFGMIVDNFASPLWVSNTGFRVAFIVMGFLIFMLLGTCSLNGKALNS